MSGCQQRQVEDVVLPGTDQFLAIQQQYRQVTRIDEGKFRYVIARADFGDPDVPAGAMDRRISPACAASRAADHVPAQRARPGHPR